jgi:hypothetical protein
LTASARRARALAALTAQAGLIACAGGPSLQSAPPPALDLSGVWTLDASSSTSPGEAFAAAVAATAPARARHAQHHGGSGPRGRGQDEPGGYAALGPPRRDPRDTLAVLVPEAPRLQIEQLPAELRMRFTGYGTQRLRYGVETSLILQVGTGKRVAGWEDDAFVVHTQLKEGLKIDDRYRVSADRARLVRELTINSPQLDSGLVVRLLYDASR